MVVVSRKLVAGYLKSFLVGMQEKSCSDAKLFLMWRTESSRLSNMRTIQLLMGHAHLEHTTRYLHMSQRHLHAAPNPLDQITVSSQRFSRMRPDDYQA